MLKAPLLPPELAGKLVRGIRRVTPRERLGFDRCATIPHHVDDEERLAGELGRDDVRHAALRCAEGCGRQ